MLHHIIMLSLYLIITSLQDNNHRICCYCGRGKNGALYPSRSASDLRYLTRMSSYTNHNPQEHHWQQGAEVFLTWGLSPQRWN